MRKLRLPLLAIWQREFAKYTWTTFQRDVLAGITVGAVALPLALAFGVASGADAAAGLVTAILAGIVIAALGGGAYQISGPTGAMSAVLIVLAQRYGLQGIWVASVLAGLFIALLGLFRLGRYVAFIPSPVITGFTSGIALIIAIGQLDNILGVQTPQAESALGKVLYYLMHPPLPDWHTLLIAGVVMVTMIILPHLTRAVPGSLVGLVLASLLAVGMHWQVPIIGDIPRTILLEQHLTWSSMHWNDVVNLLSPAVAIAALGAIESLLCGAVGANMTGLPFDTNQELIGQGVGNMLIPFFGGVPATAAIARSSVAIKSGGVTRMTSFVHAGVLLLSVFVLAPMISQVPLAALGGVLLVTAWRMNEWESIHFFSRRGLRHALVGMLITMLATVALDLTQAILIGIVISALIYLRQSSESISVTSAPVDAERIQTRGHNLAATSANTHVYYLAGPLFFGSVHTVLEAFETARDYRIIVISMRGVPLVDATGVQAMTQIVEEQHHRGGEVCLSGMQPGVEKVLAQAGVIDLIGAHNIFWSVDQAIMTLEQRYHRSQESAGPQTLAPFPAHLRVADVMTRDVYTVQVTTPVSEIVTLLLDQTLRWLPVVDDQRRVVGVITEGDLLRREIISLTVAMKQLLPLPERAAAVLALEKQSLCAADLLTPAITVRSDASLETAAQQMVQHTLKRMPVVDAQGYLVGILARSDLLGTVSEIAPQPAGVAIAFDHRTPHQVGDVMQRDVPVVQPATPLVDVLDQVLKSPQRRAVVLEAQQVVGLITDGDVLKRAARHVQAGVIRRMVTWLKGDTLPPEVAVALQGQVAADIMTSRVLTVQTTTSIVAAIQQLVDEDVVGLPVVDAEQRFQGWVDRMALLHALVYQQVPAGSNAARAEGAVRGSTTSAAVEYK